MNGRGQDSGQRHLQPLAAHATCAEAQAMCSRTSPTSELVQITFEASTNVHAVSPAAAAELSRARSLPLPPDQFPLRCGWEGLRGELLPKFLSACGCFLVCGSLGLCRSRDVPPSHYINLTSFLPTPHSYCLHSPVFAFASFYPRFCCSPCIVVGMTVAVFWFRVQFECSWVCLPECSCNVLQSLGPFAVLLDVHCAPPV